MFLSPFVQQSGDEFSFTAEQASRFAKQIAMDFNPIHDEDSKRFCVPGDLLFAYLLSQYGLTESLSCRFDGMVSANVLLHFVQDQENVQIVDQNGKVYLSMRQSGVRHQECQFIEQLVKDYVRFSGMNFPHILQPLMKAHQLMINPQRPLVIYQSMTLDFLRFSAQCPSLHLSSSELTIDGKRGNVLLQFELRDGAEVIGKGEKRMILSNLVPYDEVQMQAMVDFYNGRKESFSVAA
jgi:hypothetical protein